MTDVRGEAAVETQGLAKSYGDVKALCGVDLVAEHGSVFGLLGPNGAGKTTAVRILTTLLVPDSGTARVAGFDVLEQPGEVRKSIGLAGQYAAVDENLNGFENLELVGRLYHMGRHASRERSRELLVDFGLEDASERLVRTYSGGMRRRLDLAAALVARPPILFLDEPTTGLDLPSRIALWEAIEALVGQGTTVLLTTQYLDEADRLADQIAVVDHGVVIAEGTSDELKEQVGGERLEIQLGDGGTRDQAISALRPISEEEPACVDGLLSVPLRSRQGAIADAVRRLDEAGVGIDDIAVRRPTLDDVFLKLTGHAAEVEPESRGRGAAGSRGGEPMTGFAYAFSDTAILAKRSILRIRRQPDLLVGFTVQPVMFVLLFVYVFGGAIETPGLDYVDFLIPGIMVQSMVFGGFVTALGLAEDLKKGLIDRFRSLPMWGPAVLAGRILADVGTNIIQLVVMFAVGIHRRLPLRHGPPRDRRGHPALAPDRLRVLLGVRLHRADRVVPGGRERVRLHHPLPGHVRLVRVRPGGHDAGLAPARRGNNPFTTMVDATRALFIDTPAGTDVWGSGPLVLRDHRRLRRALGLALPQGRHPLTKLTSSSRLEPPETVRASTGPTPLA